MRDSSSSLDGPELDMNPSLKTEVLLDCSEPRFGLPAPPKSSLKVGCKLSEVCILGRVETEGKGVNKGM